MLGKVRYAHSLKGESRLKSGEPADAMPLLDLPTFVAKAGIVQLELCHFHLPSIKSTYLSELKAAIKTAGLTLENILIDRGNLSDPNDAAWKTEIEISKMWFRIAADLGANGCRVDCGTEPPTPAAKARAADALQQLADYAATLQLTLTTENFKATSVHPDHLLDIMKMVDRPINLCVDFGNAAKSGDKFGTLQKLLPLGTSLHCKGEYLPDGKLDQTDFEQSLSFVKAAGFSGFASLIVDEAENEWEKTLELKQEMEAILQV